MQIVLNKTVQKLGYRGDVVSVKRGYFRNFLYPNGLADFASKERVKLAELRKGKMVMEKQQLIDNASDILAKLKGLSVTVTGKVADSGKLYGSVSVDAVIDAILNASGVKLEKEFLQMDHIKEVGEHDVVVTLGEGLSEVVKVLVEPLK